MADGSPKRQWWECDDPADVHGIIEETLKYYDKAQTYVTEANLQHMKLYNNTDVRGFLGRQYAQMKNGNSTDSRVTMNVVKNMCDTVTAKITKVKPKATFLTKDGNWSMQRKAKKLDRFVEGLFESGSVYRTMARSFLDACVFGTGFVKVLPNYADGKIECERVFPEEVIVDDEESRYEAPRTIYQWKLLTRDQVIADYADGDPTAEAAIMQAQRADDKFGKVRNWGRTDQIRVVEAWHLPSGPNSGDGKRAIVIHNKTLVFDDYKKDYFPFAVIRWKQKLLGYWGFGLAEELAGIQREINKLLRRIQDAMHRLAVVRVFVEKGSAVVKSHLTNRVADIVEYTGNPPIIDAPQTVHPEVFSHLDRLYQRAFEIAGISQLSAQGTKPAGLNSGVALREFSDIESERFSDVQQMYEEFMLDIAKLAIECTKDVADQNDGAFEVQWAGKHFLESIKWADVSMEEDQYVMQAFPTNFLPNTPAGRLQSISELTELGFIDKDNAMALLDFPDLDAFMSLKNAAVENIKAMVENMLDGKYEPPEPFQHLELAVSMVQQAYLKAELDKAPEEILESFRIWMKAAADMLAPPEPPAPPPQPEMAGTGGVMPNGAPMPPGADMVLPGQVPSVGAPAGEVPLA